MSMDLACLKPLDGSVGLGFQTGKEHLYLDWIYIIALRKNHGLAWIDGTQYR